MSGLEFVIPLRREDLLQRAGVTQYVVDEVFPVRSLAQKLQDCKKQVKSEGCLLMLSSFDTFFSILTHFESIDLELKQNTWNLLLQVMTVQSSTLVKVLEGDLDANCRQTHLNALKMNCYLMNQFCQKFETAVSKPLNAATTATVKGRKKSTKASTSEGENLDWESGREDAVKALLQLLQLGINRLWTPPIVEEEFINLVSNVCYKILESPSVSKNKALRDTIFQLLGIMVKRFNHAIGCTLKMLQLLQQFEHLAAPLAQAVDLFVNSFGVRAIVSEIMREIGRMDPKELARDTSGTRAYAMFLVELAQYVPEVMLPNISVLMVLLDGESYTMRNSVLGAIGEMVVRILSHDDLDSKQKLTRDQFLDKLEDHLHDVNAFVRSKVLQIWMNIVNAKALPLPRQHGLLQLVIGRLQDKSSSVRKNAVQLLTSMMKMNQLAAQLTPEELKVNYEAEREKLEVMAPKPTNPVEDGGRDGDRKKESLDLIWSSIEAELKEEIKRAFNSEEVSQKDEEKADEETADEEKMDEQEPASQIPEDETVDSAKGRLIDLIKAKDFKAAISLYQAIEKLSAAERPKDKADDADEETDEVDDDNDDDKSDDRSESLSKEEKKLLNGLRNIFLGTALCSSVLEAAVTVNNAVELDENIVNPVSKQQVLVQYLKDSLNFVTEVYGSVPIVCQLLSSKVSSDVLESIDFFVSGYEIGVSSCLTGIRKMLPLVWSKEQGIKDAVVAAYKRIYLVQNPTNPRSQAVAVANSLISLTIGATLGDLTSLEELVQEFVHTGELNSRVIQVLWEKFAMKIAQTSVAESRGALMLLGMAAGSEVETVQSNISTLIKEGLGIRGEEDFLLAKDTCDAFSKLAGKNKGDALQKPFRLSQDHELFQRLSHLLVSGMVRVDRSHYVPLAEQAINLIYKLAEHPDTICAEIIRLQVAAVLGSSTNKGLDTSSSAKDGAPTEDVKDVASAEENVAEENVSKENVAEELCGLSSAILTRFVFVCGHVAFNELIHLDVAIFGELKRRHALMEEKKQKGKGLKNKPNIAVSASISKAAKDAQSEATMEEEMGLAGAAAEDAEAEYIRKITESDIVTGKGNLLAMLEPFIIAVCTNQSKFNHPDLKAAATLALSKFMIVSSEFCEGNLPLLFTILEKSSHPIVRANAIIALGDLTFRFPNLIEPWTAHIYNRLRDESIHVRKNTIMVLTHLILNDMIKVKGQISELAMCVIDENPQILAIAKQFFHELGKKGNAIYNILPDVISRLSDPDIGVEEEQFRSILKFLVSFVQKERQCESLVEKLCHRFRATRVERQWRDLAFCLSLISFNDKSIRKLQENYACFADKLSEEFVYECFMTIINGAKKLAKPEVKAQVDELEQRIEQSHSKCVEEDETAQKASKASTAAKSTRSKSTKTPGRKAAQSKSKAAKKYKGATDDESESNEEDEVRQTKTVTKKKPVLQLSSDDDSDFDIPAPPPAVRTSSRRKATFVENDIEDEVSESDAPPSVIRKPTKSVSNRAAAQGLQRSSRKK